MARSARDIAFIVPGQMQIERGAMIGSAYKRLTMVAAAAGAEG